MICAEMQRLVSKKEQNSVNFCKKACQAALIMLNYLGIKNTHGGHIPLSCLRRRTTVGGKTKGRKKSCL